MPNRAFAPLPPKLRTGLSIIGILLLVAIIPSFVFVYWHAADQAYRDATTEARRDVIGITAGVTNQLSRSLETIDLILRDISVRITSDSGRWFTEYVTEYPQLRGLLLTDAQGVVRYSTVDSLVGQSLSDRNWMARLANGPPRLTMGTPEPGRYLGAPGDTIAALRRWTIPIARPVLSMDGEFMGAAVALLNPDYLTVVGNRMGDAFHVTVRYHGMDGVLIAAAPGTMNGIGVAPDRAWMFRDFLPDLDNGTQVGRDSAGRDALAAFAVTASGLMVVEVSQDMDTVLAPARERTTVLALGLTSIAGVTMLGLGVVTWFSGRIAGEQIAARSAQAQSDATAAEATALRNARAETQRLLGGLPAVIFRAVLHPDGHLSHRYIGGNILAVTGWHAEQLATPDGWHAVLEPDRLSQAELMLRVKQDRAATEEYRMRQPDGNWRWLRTAAMVLDERSDGTTEIVGHIVDISREKAVNAQVSAAGRLTSLGEMASNLAHELRQPLAVMSLAAENMVRAVDKQRFDTLKQRAERIVDQAARASNIIEHLRRFARGVNENEPLAPFLVRDAVDGALALVGGALHNADIALTIGTFPPETRALGHQLSLEQVLLNLLINAYHQLESRPVDSGRRIAMDVEVNGEAGELRIVVRDNGGGIAAEILPRIFEPFTTTKGPEKGTGLGLSICHGLMKSMGGRIEASNMGDGACFTVALQLAVATTPA